jgi:hypothetical protein
MQATTVIPAKFQLPNLDLAMAQAALSCFVAAYELIWVANKLLAVGWLSSAKNWSGSTAKWSLS